MNVTKPYFIHILQDQGELHLIGFKSPEPVLKTQQVQTAGWGSKRDFPENKTMFKTRRPFTYPMVAAQDDKRIPAKIVPYFEQPYYGHFIKI